MRRGLVCKIHSLDLYSLFFNQAFSSSYQCKQLLNTRPFNESLCISAQPQCVNSKKGKGSPYSITERTVPELIPVLGSQPEGDVSHKPDGRLPLLSARPAVTPATLKRAATCTCLVNRGTMGVNSLPKLLPDSVATAI